MTRLAPYRHYPPGEVVCRREGPADAPYFVREGRVEMSVYVSNGKELILDLRGPYDIFGALLLLESER